MRSVVLQLTCGRRWWIELFTMVCLPQRYGRSLPQPVVPRGDHGRFSVSGLLSPARAVAGSSSLHSIFSSATELRRLTITSCCCKYARSSIACLTRQTEPSARNKTPRIHIRLRPRAGKLSTQPAKARGRRKGPRHVLLLDIRSCPSFRSGGLCTRGRIVHVVSYCLARPWARGIQALCSNSFYLCQTALLSVGRA